MPDTEPATEQENSRGPRASPLTTFNGLNTENDLLPLQQKLADRDEGRLPQKTDGF